jgi:gag-polypeptide of LTR copia-type
MPTRHIRILSSGFTKFGKKIKKLSTSEDYPIWRQHMEYALSAQGFWDYVNGLEPQPQEPQYGYKLVAPTVTALQLKRQQVDHQTAVKAALDAGQQPPTEPPALIPKEDAKDLLAEIEVQIKENKIWLDEDTEAYMMINSMVGSSALQRVMGTTTSKQLWDALQTEYETKGPRILLADFKTMSSSKILDFKTPGEYVKAVTEAASRLDQMDFHIQDHVVVLFLLQGLTPDWHSVKSRYLGQE